MRLCTEANFKILLSEEGKLTSIALFNSVPLEKAEPLSRLKSFKDIKLEVVEKTVVIFLRTEKSADEKKCRLAEYVFTRHSK